MMDYAWHLFIAFVASWALTGWLIRYANAKNLYDNPNKRSSHKVPTPRIGGVSFVVIFLLYLALMWAISLASTAATLAFSIGGISVAIVGLIDDYKQISVVRRLIVQFSAIGWSLYCFGGMATIEIFKYEVSVGWFGNLIALFALVWLLNLYNFMDGIDGIAAMETVSSTVSVGVFFLILKRPDIAAIDFILAVSVFGFFIWNFPKAKIFMGDVGSGFIGFMLGALIVHSTTIESKMFWIWLILLGVFIIDSTITLIRRAIRGEQVYTAHRSHAYQYAARIYGNHYTVTLGIFVINVIWLMPWSIAVLFDYVEGVTALLTSYFPLVLLAIYYHAGELESS